LVVGSRRLGKDGGNVVWNGEYAVGARLTRVG